MIKWNRQLTHQPYPCRYPPSSRTALPGWGSVVHKVAPRNKSSMVPPRQCQYSIGRGNVANGNKPSWILSVLIMFGFSWICMYIQRQNSMNMYNFSQIGYTSNIKSHWIHNEVTIIVEFHKNKLKSTIHVPRLLLLTVPNTLWTTIHQSREERRSVVTINRILLLKLTGRGNVIYLY